MYKLLTERMYLVLSNMGLAKAVSAFNVKNIGALAYTEPSRPDEYYTISGQRRYLRMEKREADRCESFRFWLYEKGEKEVIGTVCISSVIFGSVKSCYLSYKVDSDKQGMGLATEAVREVIDFAFNVLELHRIETLVMPSNAKSIRIMEKTGFMPEGVSKACLEVNGQWEDHIRFALINDKVQP
ncbi:MAG: GNAT family protein [Oscillospiraceae bacterium]